MIPADIHAVRSRHRKINAPRFDLLFFIVANIPFYPATECPLNVEQIRAYLDNRSNPIFTIIPNRRHNDYTSCEKNARQLVNKLIKYNKKRVVGNTENISHYPL